MARLLLVLVVVTTGTCGPREVPAEGDASVALPGHWSLDRELWTAQALEAYRTQAGVDDLDVATRERMLSTATERFSAFDASIVFFDDGRFDMQVRSGDSTQRFAGRWARDGDEVTLSGTPDHVGAREQRRRGTLRGDRLDLAATPDEPRAVYLRVPD